MELPLDKQTAVIGIEPMMYESKSYALPLGDTAKYFYIKTLNCYSLNHSKSKLYFAIYKDFAMSSSNWCCFSFQ